MNLKSGILKSDLINSVDEFMPETYRLDVVSDLYLFLNSKTGGLWIEKKSQSNQGRGIRLIADIEKYREELLIKKSEDSTELFEKMLEEKTD